MRDTARTATKADIMVSYDAANALGSECDALSAISNHKIAMHASAMPTFGALVVRPRDSLDVAGAMRLLAGACSNDDNDVRV